MKNKAKQLFRAKLWILLGLSIIVVSLMAGCGSGGGGGTSGSGGGGTGGGGTKQYCNTGYCYTESNKSGGGRCTSWKTSCY